MLSRAGGPISKAQFARSRPMTESVEQVIAAAGKAGIRGMTRQDIYMARRVAMNKLALIKASEAIGGVPPKDEDDEPESTPEPEETGEKLPRRKRMSRVPAAGRPIHRVHVWLTHYVREYGRGPPNLAAIASGAGLPESHAGTYVTALRRAKVIDYEYRDLRTMRILRPPVVEPQPTNGAVQARPASPVVEVVPEAPKSGPGPKPYLHQLQADLTRILGAMALRGIDEFDPALLAQVGAKVSAMRDLLTLLAEDVGQ